MDDEPPARGGPSQKKVPPVIGCFGFSFPEGVGLRTSSMKEPEDVQRARPRQRHEADVVKKVKQKGYFEFDVKENLP